MQIILLQLDLKNRHDKVISDKVRGEALIAGTMHFIWLFRCVLLQGLSYPFAEKNLKESFLFCSSSFRFYLAFQSQLFFHCGVKDDPVPFFLWIVDM